MKFGLFLFAHTIKMGGDNYAPVLDAIRAADRSDLTFVSVPERHFHEFGGLFPNPVPLAAAIAAVTERVEIRAGSLLLPLHHPIRVVEDWSMIDCLSGGRVALAFGSGWNVDDFVFSPESFASRRISLADQVELVRKLWRVGSGRFSNGAGVEVEVRLFPRPVQPELPTWITSSGSMETFKLAGSIGANVLTHTENFDLQDLSRAIDVYRNSRVLNGFPPEKGIVTLMQHTLVHPLKSTKEEAVQALERYIAGALALESVALQHGGEMSGNKRASTTSSTIATVQAKLAQRSARKYGDQLGLIGDIDHCVQHIQRLREIGVNEIACLVDFPDSSGLMMSGLPHLFELAERYAPQQQAETRSALLSKFMDG